ncbi:hypothetical protein JCM10908_000959 [Rhodotorula pacifica]|uniref:uncharacterized protein n=1 Tax=Rhodotorula pacifica TaxID=1495444 RepID=UPI0031781BB0
MSPSRASRDVWADSTHGGETSEIPELSPRKAGRLDDESEYSGSPTMTGTSMQTEPIRIPPSQAGEAFSFSSGTSFLSPSRALDGPLHALLPSLSISTDSHDSPSHLRANQVDGASAAARPSRRLSGLSAYLSSPPRSSPLSRSIDDVDGDDSDDYAVLGSNRRRSARRLSYSFESSPAHSARAAQDPWASRSHRRQSSAASNIKSGSLTTSSPFIGSFEDSLLQGRMSAPPAASFDFVASIGVLGSGDLPIHRRCPPHLHVPFSAVFYASTGEPRSSPYVGSVDLYRHYLRLLDPPDSAADSSMPAKLPRFPGYPVPERGQVQIVLKDSNETAFRPFLVPYDLTGLDQDGEGGRTFVRQKSYAVEQHDGKGRLCFAVHLHFCSPPERKRPRRNDPPRSPRYYLYHTIRVVFASRGSEPSDEWRTICESPDSSTTFTSDQHPPSRFAPYSEPPAEWNLARKKAKERRKALAIARLEASTSTIEPTRPDFSSPPITTSTLSHVSAAPPVVVSTTVPSLPPIFSFDRVPSPAPGQLEKRSVSALSALRPTASPTSADATSPPASTQPLNTAERERCGR